MAKKIKLAKSRKLAYKWICATFSRDAYLREIIDADRAHIFGSGKIDAKQNGQASSYSNAISKADFDYAQKLAFYVVMTYGTLDELLDLCLESDQKIKNNLKYAFRLSAAESLYLDKEDYIVVSQGVELVRSFNRHADKFANAILRKVCQKAKTFAGDAASELQKYSRLYGLPQDFIELVIAEHGQDFALKYFDTNLQVAPTHLVNFCGDKSKVFAADLSSQFIAFNCACVIYKKIVKEKMRSFKMLEIGSGRGTKTLLILHFLYLILKENKMRGIPGDFSFEYTCIDLHRFKLDIAKSRLKDFAAPNLFKFSLSFDFFEQDACDLSKFNDFDYVFIDAPCTCSGTLRRHPEARWKFSKEKLQQLSLLQKTMLKEASKHLASNAYFQYSTCSIFNEEDSEIVCALESEIQVMDLESFARPYSNCGFDVFKDSFVDGCFAYLPTYADSPDGHFSVILKK